MANVAVMNNAPYIITLNTRVDVQGIAKITKAKLVPGLNEVDAELVSLLRKEVGVQKMIATGRLIFPKDKVVVENKPLSKRLFPGSNSKPEGKEGKPASTGGFLEEVAKKSDGSKKDS